MPAAFRRSGIQFREFGRGDDTVGSPRRAQISQLDLFELVLLSKSGKRFSVERFEPTISVDSIILHSDSIYSIAAIFPSARLGFRVYGARDGDRKP